MLIIANGLQCNLCYLEVNGSLWIFEMWDVGCILLFYRLAQVGLKFVRSYVKVDTSHFCCSTWTQIQMQLMSAQLLALVQWLLDMSGKMKVWYYSLAIHKWVLDLEMRCFVFTELNNRDNGIDIGRVGVLNCNNAGTKVAVFTMFISLTCHCLVVNHCWLLFLLRTKFCSCTEFFEYFE